MRDVSRVILEAIYAVQARWRNANRASIDVQNEVSQTVDSIEFLNQMRREAMGHRIHRIRTVWPKDLG